MEQNNIQREKLSWSSRAIQNLQKDLKEVKEEEVNLNESLKLKADNILQPIEANLNFNFEEFAANEISEIVRQTSADLNSA